MKDVVSRAVAVIDPDGTLDVATEQMGTLDVGPLPVWRRPGTGPYG